MLRITNANKKIETLHARKVLNGLGSDRQIEEKISIFERSKNDRERIQAIIMRSIIDGDTERSFQKACKIHEKTCKERVRVIA